jgi:pimeloyl-ACP methyl ester carboxylesterase
MPLVRINADGVRPVPRDDLDAALRSLPAAAPVMVLIHGYKYTPRRPERCPHEHILSLKPREAARAMSWPRHLGFGRGEPAEGLCIAFGWTANGSLWRAHAEALRAATALAEVIRTVHRTHPVPVHLVGHSLGARVALGAFADLPAGSVGRALLLAGAETRAAAEAALATPAGRAAEIVNVRTRENAIFDLLFRAAIHPHRLLDRALGAGLARDDRRWLDLAIDCPRARAHLAQLGYRVPPPVRAICHWSAYLRPGLFPLYRALLRDGLPLAALRLPASEPLPPVRALFPKAVA